VDTATETQGDTVVEITPGAPIIERRITRSAVAAAAAIASRSSDETSVPVPTCLQIQMESPPASAAEQRGRDEARTTPGANETQTHSKSSERKVQGNLD
jgi:hypothetical protein